MHSEFKTIELEKMKFYVSQKLSEDYLIAGTECEYDYMHRDFCFRIKAYIYGQSKKGIEITYPDNWLEAVKERFYPKFLLKKYPVKYKIIKVDFNVLYPDFKPVEKLGNYEAHIIVERS